MLSHGVRKVTKAGTPLPLTATSTNCTSVTITAFAGNTKEVAIGGANVLVAEKEGIVLAPGDRVQLTAGFDKVDDLSKVFVDSEVNGEGVSFAYGHNAEG